MDGRKIRIPAFDDQIVIAICLAVFMLLMGFYFLHRAVVNGGLIDFVDMPARPASYVVEINSASWQELANLPGLGEKLSKAIVAHRDLHGPFKNTDELMDVHGIGDSKLQGLHGHIDINSNKH